MTEKGNLYQVFVRGRSYSAEILGPEGRPTFPIKEGIPPLSRKEVVASPMTCKIVKILIKAGDIVEIDQALLITEAMKMEMPIASPMRGRIEEVLVKEGETVDTGANLLTLTLL
jgi:biotin carboxyl carrier protein